MADEQANTQFRNLVLNAFAGVAIVEGDKASLVARITVEDVVKATDKGDLQPLLLWLILGTLGDIERHLRTMSSHIEEARNADPMESMTKGLEQSLPHLMKLAESNPMLKKIFAQVQPQIGD